MRPIDTDVAIEHLKKRLYETALNNIEHSYYYEEMADNRASVWLEEVEPIDPKKVVEDYCRARNLMVVAAEDFHRFAEPIKHGGWIKMSDAYGVYWACSECGEELQRIEDFDPQFDLFPRLESIDRTNYCPHCGAKMDEVGK